MAIKINPRQLHTLLASLIQARESTLIVGAPGIGKTDIVAQAAELAGADLLISHPVVADPTDAKGLPWPKTVQKKGQDVTTEAHFLPFGELAQAMNATKLTVWFLDDLGQAAPAVQASYMQLLLARRINGHKLPDCVVFIAATNRRVDRAGVQGILEPVKSRFTTIVELGVSLEDWFEWAMQHGVPAELIAFLRLHPDKLHQFTPTADMVNSACPRTVAAVGRLMQLGLPKEVQPIAFAGAVGEGWAVEFTTFLRTIESMPEVDEVWNDPEAAPVPDEPAILYTYITALAEQVRDNTMQALLTYTTRLMVGRKAEFATLMVRDMVRRRPELASNPDFIVYLEGQPELHRIFLGTE